MALPQKIIFFPCLLWYSKPCNLNKNNLRWGVMKTDHISDGIMTKRTETNMSFLSGNLGQKSGYGEIWEFCHKEWGFHPVQCFCSEDEAWTLDFPCLLSCHCENIFMNLSPGNKFCYKSRKLLRQQFQKCSLWGGLVLFCFVSY